MNPVQLFVNQHQHAVITCVSSSVSMTTNITDSLERIPRPGLRSADATAPPRSLSQGATSSRLPAVHEPQLPAGSATATAHGSPLRAARVRTPVFTPVTSNAGRGMEDALLQRTQLENSDLRMQLALAQQLADSDRRLADSERRLQEQQFASDLQIRELTIRAELLAASALVPQPQNSNVVAVGAKYTFQLAMTTLTNFVQNPTLAGPISLAAVVDVNQPHFSNSSAPSTELPGTSSFSNMRSSYRILGETPLRPAIRTLRTALASNRSSVSRRDRRL